MIMLKKSLIELLQPGAQLNENPLAIQLYHNLAQRNFNLSRQARFDDYQWSDVVTLPLTDAEIHAIITSNDGPIDYRHRNVLIKGVKKFPSSEVYYRMDFSGKNKNPVSSIVMGLNGAGKSSFFGALEMIGLGNMNTARLHGMNWQMYLQNSSVLSKDVVANVSTVKDNLQLDYENPQAYSVPAFLISEWDIREVEGKDELGRFIYEQLGLSDFVALLDALYKGKDFLERWLPVLTQQLSASIMLNADIQLLKKYSLYLYNSEENQISTDEIERVRKILGKEKDDYVSAQNLLESKIKDYQKIHLELINNNDFIILLRIANADKVLSYLTSLIRSLHERFDFIIKGWLEKYIAPVLKGLLDPYMKDDDATIDITYDSMSRKISTPIKFKTDGAKPDMKINQGEITPRRLFNTFRLKLFAVSLKIACACCAKQIYNMNYPIIIDDVFNSSDFDNRLKMNDYIQSILDSYKSLPEVGYFPFQLILFTQDEVIANSIFKGMESKQHPAKLLRLHDYRCFDDSDKKQESIHSSVPISLVDVCTEVAECGIDRN